MFEAKNTPPAPQSGLMMKGPCSAILSSSVRVNVPYKRNQATPDSDAPANVFHSRVPHFFAASAKGGTNLRSGKDIERETLKSLQLLHIPLYRLDFYDGPLVIVYGRANYTAPKHRANAILRVGRRKSHHTETLIAQYVTRQRIC
jgi:hypothetical protein